MMLRLTTLLFAGLLAACNHSGRWISESEGGSASLAERGDTLEIVAPEGLTLWYPEPLSGDYRIRYDATVVIGCGAHDRLADLNCFWAASDPQHPDDFFARSAWLMHSRSLSSASTILYSAS